MAVDVLENLDDDVAAQIIAEMSPDDAADVLDELPRLWTHSAAEYRAAGNIPQGWGWLALVAKGDICNFVGIAFLAALTIFCFIQLAWTLAKHKEWLMMSIAIAEVLVLSLAASGILVAGGH